MKDFGASSDLPVVAIVGRPNVGKSTLVNRFIGRRATIVEEMPGVTRDRKSLDAEWNGRRFIVLDTGGWIDTDEPLAHQVSLQAERAIREADVLVMVVDVMVGVLEQDSAIARILQRAGKPVLLVVNKVDDEKRELEIWTASSLGLGVPFPVSAIHGRGSGDVLDAVVAELPPEPEVPDAGGPDDHLFAIAIVGRPNVGKSTLFNRIVGDERSVVHDMPGTTRDTIDTVVETPEGPLRFIDTAGMRRRSRVDENAEYYSVVRALQAVDKADAALLVIDAQQGVSHQDQRLGERIDAAGTAIVIVLNKWDLIATEDRPQVLADVYDRLGFLSYAPVLKISALTGRSLKDVLPALRQAEEAYHARVPTAALNKVMRELQQKHPPPLDRKHRTRILYATQGASEPPTFTIFATRPLPPSYLRYIERSLREEFDLGPTPIKIRVRQRAS
ncbi:MAG: ribosome biogenesis GTPase Der [Actinobacteria bacterium]|uniref:GTPase Der n=1 Tax=freshwater metagenome TaxID=449393 RepID=A0A6J7R0V7_9ZZZZ|nr:ribosome biogenesis GTPase Der [Actinomycetota bacterium]